MESGLGRGRQSQGGRLIVRGYRPGAIGRIVALHADYYHRHWSFGLFFEAKVARDLAEFLTRLDPARDGLWLALDGEEIVGSIAIDGHDADAVGAHLR